MNVKPLILTVSSNNHNLELLNQFLNREGYQAIRVSNLEEFNSAMSQSTQINLGLIDITGFDNSIWEWCEQLRNQQIPFLIISPRQSAVIEQQSLARGARSILIKPLIIKQLFSLIKSLLGDLE
ncbi:response regulator [Calothrix sp. CCY 0018]|uniref:response regulator n=1 Tax=Calothrix sp. CCY 0018 TaxID=3103864 RepID=UPI0039C6F3E4